MIKLTQDSLGVHVVLVVHDQLAAGHEGRPVEFVRHFKLRRCGGSHGLQEIGPDGVVGVVDGGKSRNKI